MNFDDFDLDKRIVKNVLIQGYTVPTPIQESAIPHAINGRDVLGLAQTGTGKTAAFALPILHRLLVNAAKEGRNRVKNNFKARAVILTPTRELAIQIDSSFLKYGKGLGFRTVLLIGGVSQDKQERALKSGVDIIIATPGRLMDLIWQGVCGLEFVDIFVLDEADRMLDMGFVNDVKRVIEFLPKQKQTLFFTATMQKEIMKLTDMLLHEPVKVEVTPVSSSIDTIEQTVYFTDYDKKFDLLYHIIKEKNINQALVFVKTKHGADRLAGRLLKQGISAVSIHGDKSQGARQDALEKFKRGRICILVATDIAARGIDIKELDFVVNYDLPNVPETYVHRIGRTGRAGRDGHAIAFCDYDEKPFLKDIEKLLNAKIDIVDNHPYKMSVFLAREKNTKKFRPNKKFASKTNQSNSNQSK